MEPKQKTNEVTRNIGGIKSMEKKEKYFIQYQTGERARLVILNDHVFRFYMSPTGKFTEYPVPNNPGDVAKITFKKMSDYSKDAFKQSTLEVNETEYLVNTKDIQIAFHKTKGTMTIRDKRTNKVVLSENAPLSYDNGSIQSLIQRKDEYFFGGGMQNGRFSHKGKVIQILNTNKWNDKGVASPCPFYWSSYGYGVLRNTWQPGYYDFGSKSSDCIKTYHKEKEFNAFIFINPKPSGILNDYYELTGQPILMPEYAFYEAHLDAFNRDYWVKVNCDTPGARLYEDDLCYKSYKPDEMKNKEGALESLNGEKNYQFSARAMIDRYKKHDMPLGWFLPNDGYGCGYGQAKTFNEDLENLKEFTSYSKKNGVEVGLWTESKLEPVDPKNPKKGERDLKKELAVANVVALKCDVAWIGSGYSFGLNAVEKAATMFKDANTGVRKMILMVDGWAGSQRHTGIWSGDQTGGNWEYIRFHIPTYIGTGLSGQPVFGSDMDGIFGGENRDVNIRDYQWKTFTPLQLNMDGWGRTPKTPFSFDETATTINRAYLKLKSMLMPYNYSIAHESLIGLPMLRAMFLEFPDSPLAYTIDCQYQFMWGPSLLVAPIYNNEKLGNASVRHGIFLPDPNQIWIDLFTGDKYQGGKVYNNIIVPLWKIPVFVKDGAIIPMTNPNNNPSEIKREHRIFTLYPNGKSSFVVYEDDGISTDYLNNEVAKTNVSMSGPKSNEQGDLIIIIKPTTGTYKQFVKERTTLLQIMISCNVDSIKMAINERAVTLRKVDNEPDFEKGVDVFYIKSDFNINPYLSKFDDTTEQKFLLIKINKIDVTSSEINIKIKNYEKKGRVFSCNNTVNEKICPPKKFWNNSQTKANTIKLEWEAEDDADYYEIEKDSHCFSNIQGPYCVFEDLKCTCTHSFRIRSVNRDGVSEWSNYINTDFNYSSTSLSSDSE